MATFLDALASTARLAWDICGALEGCNLDRDFQDVEQLSGLLRGTHDLLKGIHDDLKNGEVARLGEGEVVLKDSVVMIDQSMQHADSLRLWLGDKATVAGKVKRWEVILGKAEEVVIRCETIRTKLNDGVKPMPPKLEGLLMAYSVQDTCRALLAELVRVEMRRYKFAVIEQRAEYHQVMKDLRAWQQSSAGGELPEETAQSLKQLLGGIPTAAGVQEMIKELERMDRQDEGSKEAKDMKLIVDSVQRMKWARQATMPRDGVTTPLTPEPATSLPRTLSKRPSYAQEGLDGRTSSRDIIRGESSVANYASSYEAAMAQAAAEREAARRAAADAATASAASLAAAAVTVEERAAARAAAEAAAAEQAAIDKAAAEAAAAERAAARAAAAAAAAERAAAEKAAAEAAAEQQAAAKAEAAKQAAIARAAAEAAAAEKAAAEAADAAAAAELAAADKAAAEAAEKAAADEAAERAAADAAATDAALAAELEAAEAAAADKAAAAAAAEAEATEEAAAADADKAEAGLAETEPDAPAATERNLPFLKVEVPEAPVEPDFEENDLSRLLSTLVDPAGPSVVDLQGKYVTGFLRPGFHFVLTRPGVALINGTVQLPPGLYAELKASSLSLRDLTLVGQAPPPLSRGFLIITGEMASLDRCRIGLEPAPGSDHSVVYVANANATRLIGCEIKGGSAHGLHVIGPEAQAHCESTTASENRHGGFCVEGKGAHLTLGKGCVAHTNEHGFFAYAGGLLTAGSGSLARNNSDAGFTAIGKGGLLQAQKGCIAEENQHGFFAFLGGKLEAGDECIARNNRDCGFYAIGNEGHLNATEVKTKLIAGRGCVSEGNEHGFVAVWGKVKAAENCLARKNKCNGFVARNGKLKLAAGGKALENEGVGFMCLIEGKMFLAANCEAKGNLRGQKERDGPSSKITQESPSMGERWQKLKKAVKIDNK